MKLLFILAILIINQTLAKRLVPIEYIKDSNGSCQVVITKKRSNTNEGFLIYPNSLESEFCERMFPESYKDAFSINKDMPAKNLNFDINVIDRHIDSKEQLSVTLSKTNFLVNYAHAKNKLSTITANRDDFNKLSKQVDWESFYELNQSAIDLWSDLTTMYGAEQARFNYYKKRKFSKLHEKEISNFRKDVLSFLESTEIGNSWGLNLLGRVHPLISQVVLETLVIKFPYYVIDNGLEFYMGTNFGKATRYLMKKETIDWKSSFKSNTAGLSTIMNVEEDFVYKLKDDEIQHFDSLAPGLFKDIQLYLNSIYILQMISENQCSDWGLWPGSSRVVLNYLTFMRQSKVYHPHELVLNNVMEKISKACGHSSFGTLSENNSTPASVSPIYRVNTKHSKKLAKEFRKLAKRWN